MVRKSDSAKSLLAATSGKAAGPGDASPNQLRSADRIERVAEATIQRNFTKCCHFVKNRYLM